MDNKTRPSKVYIAMNLNNARNEEEYTIENEAKIILNGERNLLLHNFSIEIDQHPTSKDPPIYRPENDRCYYVNMP
jgi:acetylglutamate synthase